MGVRTTISAGPGDTYEVMLEEREVANCVNSIITQYYYFIIVMWRKGKMKRGWRVEVEVVELLIIILLLL